MEEGIGLSNRRRREETLQQGKKRLKLMKFLLLLSPQLCRLARAGWFQAQGCNRRLHLCTFSLQQPLQARLLQLCRWDKVPGAARMEITRLVSDQPKQVSASWRCKRGSPARTTGIEMEACKQRDRRAGRPPQTVLTTSAAPANKPPLGAASPRHRVAQLGGELSETYPGHKSSEAQLCRPGAPDTEKSCTAEQWQKASYAPCRDKASPNSCILFLPAAPAGRHKSQRATKLRVTPTGIVPPPAPRRDPKRGPHRRSRRRRPTLAGPNTCGRCATRAAGGAGLGLRLTKKQEWKRC